jgi:hypothetical protein
VHVDLVEGRDLHGVETGRDGLARRCGKRRGRARRQAAVDVGVQRHGRQRTAKRAAERHAGALRVQVPQRMVERRRRRTAGHAAVVRCPRTHGPRIGARAKARRRHARQVMLDQ